MRPAGLGGFVEITGRGVLLSESLGFGDPKRVTQDQAMRIQILKKIAEVRKSDPQRIILYQVTQPNEPFDEQQWKFNLIVLRDAGFVKDGPVMGSIAITELGLKVLQDLQLI